ncbi:MAG: STAS-like domain-containing protein [Candidatus Methylomirabilales bacterium]
MRGPNRHGKEIREFIIQSIPDHPRDVVSVVSKRFGVSRQAVNRHIRELLAEGYITAEGKTRQREYSLKVLRDKNFTVPLKGLAEDQVWRSEIVPLLKDLPGNVLDIWHYGFTEMVNNAIDHSGGHFLTVAMKMNPLTTRVSLHDDGIGIFRKIKEELHLEDERHAVLELAKGKLTTDPERHTGEGIFFTSRMMDYFAVLSGDVYFSHEFGREEDWILERDRPDTGTSVFMDLANNSERTDQEVFDRFASDEEDYGFTRTVVPVRLARHGAEKLVSRSQAKRLLARVDRFKTVILDFKEIDSIGRAFADEIFRVFERNNPGILLIPTNTVPEVEKMIALARRNREGGLVATPANQE